MDSRSYIPFLFLTLPVFITVFRLRSFYAESRTMHHGLQLLQLQLADSWVAIFDHAITRYYLRISTGIYYLDS